MEESIRKNQEELFSSYTVKQNSGLMKFLLFLQKRNHIRMFHNLSLYGFLQLIRIYVTEEKLFVRNNEYIIRVDKAIASIFPGNYIHMNQLRNGLLKHLVLYERTTVRPSTCDDYDFALTRQEYELPLPLREEGLPIIRPLDLKRSYLLAHPVLFAFIEPYLKTRKNIGDLFSFNEINEAIINRLTSNRKKYFDSTQNNIIVCDKLLKKLYGINAFHLDQLSTLLLIAVEEQITDNDFETLWNLLVG